MTSYNPALLSVAILDHRKPSESSRLLASLTEYLRVSAEVVYAHDGPAPTYVKEAFDFGGIDTFIETNAPQGCGIQTRRLFQACMAPYIAYIQVDQYLTRPFTETIFAKCRELLEDPQTFYIDLAGNQGHGRPSERALLMKRKRYLEIPGLDDTIGGPGPYADHPWTEALLQDYITNNQLRFATLSPTFFADNGVWSVRTQPDGSISRLRTDTKALYWETKPTERFVYPDLTDAEWDASIAGTWVDGTVPERYQPHSFNHWDDAKP